MDRSGVWRFLELYERLGFSIIPLKPRSKEPAVQWLGFQSRKPTDGELGKWFTNPEMNVGLVCGSVSDNVAVLDFDNIEAYERFFSDTRTAEKTLVVRTSRGVHVYLKSSKPVRSFKIPELSLDVKGEGSYVVAPPSTHPSGLQYEFLGSPWDVKEVPVVDDLEHYIWLRAAELGVFKHGSNEDPPCIRLLLNGVGEGMRNETAVRFASYWLYFKRLTADEALRKLEEWNSRNRPPLDGRELKNCLLSVLKHGYEYGCSSMVELGLCNERLRSICSLGETFQVKKQTIVYMASTILPDGRIVEEAYRGDKAFFIVFNPEDGSILELDEVSYGEVVYRPLMNRDVETGQVMLSSKAEEYGDDKKIFNEVLDFLNRWHEQPDEFERTLDVLYVFLSWVFDALPQIPYRRALGRWGSGKSAWIETVGSICYRPMILAGCDSEASLRRTFDLWRGTALIDEADFSESSLYASIVKVLNIGYSKALGWYRCCNDRDPRKIDSFYVYGPKLLATRSEFKDVALESRCLTFIARKGSGEAPLYRAERFRDEALKLRNKLLMWRFQNYGRVVEVTKELEKQGLFKETFNGRVEPRVAQIILPLALVFENPELRRSLIAMAESKSEEVRALDPDSWLEEEVPKIIEEMLKDAVSKKTTEVSQKRILSKVDLVDLVDVFKVAPGLQKSRTLIPLKIRNIAERLLGEGCEDSELKSTAKKVSTFIRKHLGFIVKKSTGGYYYAFIPKEFLKDGEENVGLLKEHPLHPLNPLESGESRGDDVSTTSTTLHRLNPLESKAEVEPSRFKVVGGPLPGYVCIGCGGEASKVVKFRGSQEAFCDRCLERLSKTGPISEDAGKKLSIVEPAILKARAIFEECKVPGEDYAEESIFQLELGKAFGEEASTIFEGLLRKALLIKVRGGFLKWIG